jgi:hypothetical protein
MEKQDQTLDQLSLIDAQLRLLVDLTLDINNLQGIDPKDLALVLQDINARLARIVQENVDSPLTDQCEGRR